MGNKGRGGGYVVLISMEAGQGPLPAVQRFRQRRGRSAAYDTRKRVENALKNTIKYYCR
jgi:hypothetical protein